MDKETLRMQMLSGVITESQYKEKVKKLAEGAFDNPNAPKIAEPQKGGSLQLKNAAMKIYSYIKKNGFTPYLMVDGKNIGDRMNHDFAIQVQGAGGTGASSSLAADGLLTISGNRNKTNPQVIEKLQNDIIHDFPFLEKHYQSNPNGLIIKLKVDPKANVSEELDEKDSLNEHFVAGGIVGIGAINQIPSRAKADYEDAFEYFLSQKYSLNEMEDDMPEAPSHEETDAAQVYEEEVEEGNLGHNEIASLTPEGRFWIVSWRGMDGPKEKVFTDEDEARAFMNTLEEGKEVEEPTNY